MTANNYTSEVKKIISDKLGLEGTTLAENLSFRNDLYVDSLDFCEVIWEVEKKFRVNIPDEEMENIHTIGQLIEYLDQRMAA
ncbi:MAG TPA: acyl carrier protein [Puia sp.]|nr:acyl carrier protein [Puia sp.]